MEKEKMLEQLNEAFNNLKAGRYEESYAILEELIDEVTTEIISQKTETKLKGQ